MYLHDCGTKYGLGMARHVMCMAQGIYIFAWIPNPRNFTHIELPPSSQGKIFPYICLG